MGAVNAETNAGTHTMTRAMSEATDLNGECFAHSSARREEDRVARDSAVISDEPPGWWVLVGRSRLVQLRREAVLAAAFPDGKLLR